MMNLEKMKEQRAPGRHRKWGSNVKRGVFAVTTFLCMATPFFLPGAFMRRRAQTLPSPLKSRTGGNREILLFPLL